MSSHRDGHRARLPAHAGPPPWPWRMRWPHRPPGLQWPLLARGDDPPEPPDGSGPRSSVTRPWPLLARGDDPPEPPDGSGPPSSVTGPPPPVHRRFAWVDAASGVFSGAKLP